jgi:arginine deiminase
VNLPSGHVHIDGLIMAVDERTAFVHRPVLEISPTRVMHSNGEVKHVWLLDYMSSELGFRLIDGPYGMEMNYVAFAPWRVIGYDFVTDNAKIIKSNKGEVIAIPGRELVKGNGGVHCMTCPVLRD